MTEMYRDDKLSNSENRDDDLVDVAPDQAAGVPSDGQSKSTDARSTTTSSIRDEVDEYCEHIDQLQALGVIECPTLPWHYEPDFDDLAEINFREEVESIAKQTGWKLIHRAANNFPRGTGFLCIQPEDRDAFLGLLSLYTVD